jgi:glycosyltransferase-like protein LARGE
MAQGHAQFKEPSKRVVLHFERKVREARQDRDALLGRVDPLPYHVKTLLSPESEPESEHPVCLVTQCSVDRLDRLHAQLMAWEGEVSAAIFVDEDPNTEAADMVCEKIVRVCEGAAFQRHRPPWTVTAVFRTDASEVRCPAYDCLYPINALRNVALRTARAEFVLLLDVDFVPSCGLQALDASTLGRLLLCGEDGFAALVIPAFEFRSQNCLPTNGFSVREAYAQGVAQAFHIGHFPAGHRATNFHRWLHRSSESRGGPHFYSVDYEEGFEPYVIALRSRVPPYDERFRGYGMNKISHAYEMNARGCTFRTLDAHDTFVVAREHQRSKSWHLMYDAGQEEQRARLAYHFAQFKTELQTCPSIKVNIPR